MPAKNLVPATTWLTPEEKKDIVVLAKQTRLTTSAVIRRLITGRQLPEVGQHEVVLELLKINADQARLGNLLRMALADDEFRLPDNMSLDSLVRTIRATQDTLKRKIWKL